MLLGQQIDNCLGINPNKVAFQIKLGQCLLHGILIIRLPDQGVLDIGYITGTKEIAIDLQVIDATIFNQETGINGSAIEMLPFFD